MSVPAEYRGREQTYIKHTLLRRYLSRFGYKVGSKWDCINYVDCFAGPWASSDPDLSDTSFGIAVDELSKAQKHLREIRRNIRLRFCFVESDKESFKQLKRYVERRCTTDIEMVPLEGEFEQLLPHVQSFLDASGSNAFRFLLIDPKGWTGFALRNIAPLIERRSAEVLVNVMTSYIRRFVTKEAHASQFEELFDDKDVITDASRVRGGAREELLVRRYAERLKTRSALRFTSRAAVLKAEQDSVHYYLVFGTNSPHGIQVFKDAEQVAFSLGEAAREEARSRKRERRTGQTELQMFGNPSDVPSSVARELRAQHLREARQVFDHILSKGRKIAYDEVLAVVLQSPTVWKTDLDGWICDLLNRNQLKITPALDGRKTLQLDKNYLLVRY